MVGLIPGLRKIPWRRKWQPTPAFLPRKAHRQRSLAGCSPWDHKVSDTTEQELRTLLENAREGKTSSHFNVIAKHSPGRAAINVQKPTVLTGLEYTPFH